MLYQNQGCRAALAFCFKENWATPPASALGAGTACVNKVATLAFSSPSGLLERVRQCLQRRLALPVRAWATSQPEAQVWQIGSVVRLLATPSVAGAPPPHPAATDYPRCWCTTTYRVP
jgi:hypothetical protein